MSSYTCTSRFAQAKQRFRPQKTNVQDYGDWLNSLEWDYYCTFTTDYTLSLPSARRAMERLLSRLIKEFGTVNYFWVAEPFDTKEGCHTHALLKVPSLLFDLAAPTIERKWHQVTKVKKTRGKHKTHVIPYIKGKGGHYYLGKYLGRHNSDHDFSFS